jgi:uncharacterized membrane protein
LVTSFRPARSWLPRSAVGSGAVGSVATLGAVAAGAAILEATLIPGLLIGGAAMLAPRLLPRKTLNGLWERRRRTAPSPAPAPSTPTARSTQPPSSADAASFDTWRAVVKTLTYRVMVTTVDFGANYFVLGELATAASLSSLSLVAGPIAYFAHEAAWHYYGSVSARRDDPHAAIVQVPIVQVPIPGATQREDNGRARFASVTVSRALAKTVTYEVVTGVSEFSVNYLFVRDLVAAAGLTAFSIAVAPFVYYVHEKAWDYYDTSKARAPAAPVQQLLPAA